MDVEINYSLNYDFLSNILKTFSVSSALSILDLISNPGFPELYYYPLLLIFPGILILYLYAEKKINSSVHRCSETKASKRFPGNAETGGSGL
jgi:hypothetical protein